MAIEKNCVRVSRFDSELSPHSRDTMSSDDEELPRRVPAVESDYDDDDDEFDDADSGAGSDDFDLLELGETGAEFCQVGNVTCSVPFELYALPGLEDVLSVDVWNDVLTEEEKFGLTKYLPDMDQEMFARTLKDLFEGANFHFGSPIKKLFEMLKGGLCEPRVALYREGLNFFRKRMHYHCLRNHQNNIVSNLCQIRDAWHNCKGYSIDEKLRVLNIVRSQKSLMYEKMEEDLESDSPEKEEVSDRVWGKGIKDRKSAVKLSRDGTYDSEHPSRLPSVGLEVPKYGKKNPKGILKLAGMKAPSSKEIVGRGTSLYHGMDVSSKSYGSGVPASRQNKLLGYDSIAALRQRDRIKYDDDVDVDDDDIAGDPVYGMGVHRDRNAVRGGMLEKAGLGKAGKKHALTRSDELANDGFTGLPFSSKTDLRVYGRSRTANQRSELEPFTEKPSSVRNFEISKKSKYPEKSREFAVGNHMKSQKGRASDLPLKGNRVDLLEHTEQTWLGQNQGQTFSVDSSFKSEDWNMKNKKWKIGRESPDLNFKGYRTPPSQIDDRILLSDLKAKASQEKIRGNSVQNGRTDKGTLRASRAQTKNEETESDSSEQYDEEDDDNPMMRSKSVYASGMMEGSRSSMLKPRLDGKKGSYVRKDMQENSLALDGSLHLSKRAGTFGELGYLPEYTSKTKQKGKMRDSSQLHGSTNRAFDDSSPFVLGKFQDDVDRKLIHRLSRNGQLRGEYGESLSTSSLRAYSSDTKHKGDASHDEAADEDLFETRLSVRGGLQGRLGKKGQRLEAYAHDRRDRSEASLLGCNSVTKKRKVKDEMMDMGGTYDNGNSKSNLRQLDESISSKKKGKRKLEVEMVASDVETFEPPFAETAPLDVELETKPQKKPYTPITPTVHTDFSFSIIHLLSAVRMAMVTPFPEDSLEVNKLSEMQNRNPEDGNNVAVSPDNSDANKSKLPSEVNAPSLTVQEIVNRVQSNPGDPCILETQEPLHDLVRGVLKIFSSKSAPLGAKGWKALVVYEKSTKSWSWIGPLSHTSADHETVEEVTSPEYWGLPHKMLVKLVDSFANWLKCGQETLQQIGSLPAPPLALMQCNLDEKERFRDLRAQKSLNTISPSSEEVRAYFRKEEVLRYSIPDRAFSYTAADGKKSIVAPLRRCGGKPTSKARDHFMLKRDRPPHVTILCLVRDAAARLPGSIGTRADVCTLIRDSQYIVEDVSDAQVNQVVSGALDRLHYERDPCVQFDGDRKLWVYLHREREEEDFEDDGTSSTKKWKRQKKDLSEQSEQGTVTVAFHNTGDQSGFDLGSDLNIEPSGADDDKRPDMILGDARQSGEDNVDVSHGSEQGDIQRGNSMVWEALSVNSTQENKLLCQENSTNDDFEDETFGRERPVGLLSASLL
ncbi:hypothetical protein K2173_016572 [Erythroxylum novogranatense]|uniref:DEUBAD domain-containing protein n=1 Tax=Erythroxylum novogranatense TaxID=1862640 RepID=A0AAV8SGQ6_9ROSI|nr:hypothetical protein K2173_016572 [Erythroxylum novogranatense]